MWFSRIIGRFGDPLLCATRAHKSALPGANSKTRFSMPSASKIFLKNAADLASFPGGFVVSIRRYSCSHCRARSEYCLIRSAEIFAEASGALAEPDWQHTAQVTITQIDGIPNRAHFCIAISCHSRDWLPRQFLYQFSSKLPGPAAKLRSSGLLGLQSGCNAKAYAIQQFGILPVIRDGRRRYSGRGFS